MTLNEGLKEIGEKAFEKDYALKYIEIIGSVTVFGEDILNADYDYIRKSL